MTPATRIVGLAAIALAAATAVWAQAPTAGSVRIVPMFAREPSRPLSQHPAAPLSNLQRGRLERARALRVQGRLDRAREILVSLLAETPHQPEVLVELAAVDLAKKDYASIERMARAERGRQRDSVVLGHELSLAYERMGRNREAAQTAVEVWCAEPSEAEWAGATVLRLAPSDPRGTRDAMRRAVARLPDRLDLVRGLAQVEWRLGDIQAALKALQDPDRRGVNPPLRWRFASDLLLQNSSRDTTGAIDALLDLAGDDHGQTRYRLTVAHRVWDLFQVRQAEPEGAPRLMHALRDVPVDQWGADLLAGVARGLRLGGRAAEARDLLRSRGARSPLPPALALEQALAELGQGPPERALADLELASTASPEAMCRFAEALFYAGLSDSAHAIYERVAADPTDPFAGAALERMYLIEDAEPKDALPTFGRIAYEEWRGNDREATALADSLYQALPRGPLWAQSALLLSRHLAAQGDPRSALAPLLAVADSLPDDRLAPLARQRAGDLYLNRLKDDAAALAQYEECLARYPRAWNAPEVRRSLETLRRERRF